VTLALFINVLIIIIIIIIIHAVSLLDQNPGDTTDVRGVWESETGLGKGRGIGKG